MYASQHNPPTEKTHPQETTHMQLTELSWTTRSVQLQQQINNRIYSSIEMSWLMQISLKLGKYFISAQPTHLVWISDALLAAGYINAITDAT